MLMVGRGHREEVKRMLQPRGSLQGLLPSKEALQQRHQQQQ